MKKIIILIAIMLLFAVSAFAQIEGRVTDSKGNGVPNVTLTATGEDGKVAATVTTDEDGNYSFEELAPGKYKITTKSSAGFQPSVREKVDVAEDETTTLNIQLAAAAPTPSRTPAAQPAVPARAMVDEIIAKNIEALGGRDLIAKIQTIYMETTSQLMGNDAPGSVTILNGKGYLSVTEYNGARMTQCYTDKGGWTTNPMSGNTPEVMPDEQYKSGKLQIYIGGELFDYAAKGSKAELLGKDGKLYKIKLTTRDSQVSTYYIDPATYFITKVIKTGEVMGQQVDVVISYSDYKKTDFGFTTPYTTQLDFGTMFSVAIAAKKVEINKPVDPKIFEMPK